MILRMIAAGSLSAFSSASVQLPSARAPGGAALQPVRTPAVPVQPQLQLQPDALRAGAQSPSRALPRGSLLDLSV